MSRFQFPKLPPEVKRQREMKTEPRYAREVWSNLREKLYGIFRESWERTTSEVRIASRRNRMLSQIKPGARIYDDGQDMLSDAGKILEQLELFAANERQVKELTMLSEWADALEDTARELRTMEGNLSGKLGVGGSEREREKADARRKAEIKSRMII